MSNNKQQTEHRFCLTPELKCTMSYCDENGCINRKRHLVGDPIEMTNNKQQSSVQWFLAQLIEHRIIIVDKTTYQVKYKHEILLEQAKAMHKEETLKLYYAYEDYVLREEGIIKTFGQFYNETYK